MPYLGSGQLLIVAIYIRHKLSKKRGYNSLSAYLFLTNYYLALTFSLVKIPPISNEINAKEFLTVMNLKPINPRLSVMQPARRSYYSYEKVRHVYLVPKYRRYRPFHVTDNLMYFICIED